MRTLILAALLAAPAGAQTNLDRESQDRSRRGGAEQKAAETAEKAVITAPDEVTFEQVLKNPADLDLNERYAREQIDRGDLRGAAVTLERILILAPGRDRTRLLYAAVLYRLDALVDSERELRVIIGRLAPAEVIAEANAYLKLIDGRKRKTHFTVRAALGYGYDDNRNAASDTDRVLFLGSPVLLSPDSRRRDDTSVVFAGGLGVTRDFGGAKPQKAFANFGYYRGEQTLINTLDLQAYSASGGFALRGFGFELTPAAGYDQVLLSQSTYLRNVWQSLRLSRRVRPRLELWGEARREDQRFQNTRLVRNGVDRKGDQYDFALGASWVASPRDRWGFSIGHRRKLAEAVASAYRRESIGVDYTRLLGRGMFLATSVTGQFDRYDRPDTAISTDGRSDDAVVTNLLFGAPLTLLWSPLKGFTGTLGWERFSQHSNLLNYTYSNNRLTALVSYKWGI
ncbi:MAG: hypothetical protein SF051_03820 [Elusimicrobiota bacterium]|nr:hypothetical protein [Elusimicrobiota bacterium]